jgi:hypothetical protein
VNAIWRSLAQRTVAKATDCHDTTAPQPEPIQVVMGFRPVDGGIPIDPDREGYIAQIDAAMSVKDALDRKARLEQDYCEHTFTLSVSVKIDDDGDAEPPDPNLERRNAIRSAMNRSAEADRLLYRRCNPAVERDFEHAHEDARRAQAAIKSGLPSFIVGCRYGISKKRLTTTISSGLTRIEAEAPTVWLGPGEPPNWLTDVRPSARQLRLARRYWEYDAFLRSAGRAVVYARTIQGVALAARAMARSGSTQMFLKAASLKLGTWRVPLSAGSRSLTGAWKDITDVVGLHILRMPDTGPETGWLVQDFCPIVDETRVFVVNHRVVAAVPVRREDSVYSSVRAPGRRVEPRSCIAASGFPSRPDRDGPARRVRLARKVIAKLKNDHFELEDYVIDVGTNSETDKPLIIELNPLSNAGLYGCDPSVLLDALIAAKRAEFVEFPSLVSKARPEELGREQAMAQQVDAMLATVHSIIGR